ncbi:MAG: hypothetical protein MUC63_10140, partial [Planctomycetes bacterium]|nr:hypothetical protein [Planctomycetota bacterium]
MKTSAAAPILACFLAFAPSGAARADGPFFGSEKGGPRISALRILLLSDAKGADAFVQAEVRDADGPFAWIVPMPPDATVEVVREPVFASGVADLLNKLNEDVFEKDLAIYKRLIRSANPPFLAEPEKPAKRALPEAPLARFEAGQDEEAADPEAFARWREKRGLRAGPEAAESAAAILAAGCRLRLIPLDGLSGSGFTPTVRVSAPGSPAAALLKSLAAGAGLRRVEVWCAGPALLRHPLLDSVGPAGLDAKGHVRPVTELSVSQRGKLKAVEGLASHKPGVTCRYSVLKAELPAVFFRDGGGLEPGDGGAAPPDAAWWFARTVEACATGDLEDARWAVRRLERTDRINEHLADFDREVDRIVPAAMKVLEAAPGPSYEEVFPAVSLLSSAYYSGGPSRQFRTLPAKYRADLRRLLIPCLKSEHSGVVTRAKWMIER